MAMQIKIKRFIKKGFEKILCSEGANEVCRQEAVRIQGTANARNRFGGDGFEITGGNNVYLFKSLRANWKVTTTDYKSKLAEAKDKALTGSI